MVKYDYTYKLPDSAGDGRIAQKKYIVIHSTANTDATGVNEAIYMQRNYRQAYTHAVADYDRVYIVGEPGYVAWGAGNINAYSPYQIELAQYSRRKKALQAYRVWIDSIRDYASKYGIPLTLDGAGNGVKTHDWASKNYGGSNHSDPMPYLNTLGITKDQLAKDLKNGFGGTDMGDDFMVEVNYSDLGALSVIAKSGVRLYKDSKLTKPTDRTLPYGTKWVVSAIKDGAFDVGGYVGGQGVVFKLNTLAVNPTAVGTAKVTADDLYTQAKPGANQKGIKRLAKGSTWAVNGRTDKYLKVGGYINGDKVKIIL